MNDSLQARLERLEALYSEQEYTVQALNDVVANQDREIANLTLAIGSLEEQLKALRAATSSDISPEIEKPPHY